MLKGAPSSCFRTSNRENRWDINETSSYVDLSPLYGHNEAALNKARVRDGYGLLHPDTFAEDRLLLLPPAVCVLLVLFSRNHNVRLNQLSLRRTLIHSSLVHRAQIARHQ